MDPVSQGVFGAAAAQAVFGKKLPRSAWWIGWLSGMAADLDVLIPTNGDPTIGWIYHRGFTHALAFVPVGALLCAGVFLLLPPLRRSWKAVIGACFVAYLTHAPLDALTSYGTQLFWPFTDYRVALDWMPIIDPVWTLTMIVLVAVAAWRKSSKPAIAALAFAGLYFSFGGLQHWRASAAVQELAEQRGHSIERMRVMPSPAALSLWRGVYVHDGRVWAAGVHVPYVGETTVKPGDDRPLLTARDIPSDPEAQRQFRVFSWFANDLVVPVTPGDMKLVTDGRYSGTPDGFAPLWGVDFRQSPPIRYNPPRAIDARATLRAMFGRDPAYQPLPDPQ